MRLPSRLEVQAALVRRRVRRMTPEAMLLWLDTAGTEMSRAAAAYVRTREPAELAELDRGLAVLIAMSQVLHGQRD